MQPYFLPYIGYFQLINSVDAFIIYDNVQYSKGGWINRNRIINRGSPWYMTLPLKKDSDYLNINQRYLSPSFSSTKRKIIGVINANYRRSKMFSEVMPIIGRILDFEDDNLFAFLENSLLQICKYLSIETSIIKSSYLKIDHTLKSQERLIAMCKHLGADKYLNPIGGTELYSRAVFLRNDIDLNFLKTDDLSYNQNNERFVPNLSVLDILMHCEQSEVRGFLDNYSLTY